MKLALTVTLPDLSRTLSTIASDAAASPQPNTRTGAPTTTVSPQARAELARSGEATDGKS